MPEKMSQFNFSKKEDQEKFEKLGGEERAEILNKAHEEALEENKLTPEKRTAVIGMVERLLRGGVNDSSEAIAIKNKFNFPDSILQLPRIREAAKFGLISQLSRGLIDGATRVRDEYAISFEETQSSEVQNAIKEGMIHCFSMCQIDKVTEISDKFDLSETTLQDALIGGISYCLKFGFVNEVLEIKKKFNPSSGVIQSPDVQIAVKIGMIDCFVHDGEQDRSYSARKIRNEFNPSEEMMQSQEFQAAAEKSITQYLSSGKTDQAISIKEEFGCSDAIMQTSQNRDNALRVIDRELYNGYVGGAIKIKDAFNFSDDLMEEIVKKSSYPQEMTFNDLKSLYGINQIGSKLCASLSGLRKFSYHDQIKPLMLAQGDSAFLYFESIKKVPRIRDTDVEYVTYIGKKYGTQSRNILENILSKTNSISGEREIIEEFIIEIGVMDFSIYTQYKKAKEGGNNEEVEKLKERIGVLKNDIYKGEMKEENFSDDLYKAVSYNAFPPAIGLTQNQYEKLNRTRSDRRADVSESLDDLQYQKFKVPTGRYVLAEGEDLSLDEWSALSRAVKKVNQELAEKGMVEIDGEEIGGKLIEIYRSKKQNIDEGRDYIFESMYRYHLSCDGGKLDDGYEMTVAGLMKYKEFIGDRIKNDLIEDCLADWREKHADEYEELKKETMNRLKQSQNENFAKVRNMSEAIRKQKDETKKVKAITNLDDFLSDFGLSYVGIKDMDQKALQTELSAVPVEYDGEATEDNYRSEGYYNSEAFTKAYDEFVGRSDQNQLVVKKISSDLVAGTNKKMRKEMDKFEFSGGGGVEERELEFVISKKKEHGVAGFNMGVCVAPDEKLWNDPQFMNCIIFDPEDKQAMGGMHFLIRENCLCLPGINPSLDVLGQVKNEELFEKMIAHAKQVKEKLGLEKVLIPTNNGIFSNRTQIHEIVRNKNYKKYSLKQEAEFSHSPHRYSFQECFEV